MPDTVLSELTEIIENLGGTTDAEYVVPALEDLKELLGEGGISEAVANFLTEHGASVSYSVTNGDLSVVLMGGE